jgi:hypothetical protein
MADNLEEKKKDEQKQKSKGSQKKAALIVSLVCVGVVAAIVLMNGDRLSVNSDVSNPPPPEEEEAEAPAPNTVPEIISVVAATDRISPFDLCEVTCEAVDPDGDPLTYTWESAQGDVYGEGPVIEWGAPTEEGLYRLSVTVEDDRGGSADFSISLRVRANLIPQIVTMSASSEWIVPGESVVVSATTQDGDNDELTYEWSCRAGEFLGQGTSVLWIAPEEIDSYWITLDVADAYGGEARRAIPISVTEGEPPTLGAFKIEGIGTDLVKPTGDAWKIFRGRSCSIECVVLEGEAPFTYEWSAEMGTLHQDGSPIATWDAPEGREQLDIVVKVTDSHGNSTSGSVLMYVETCTCAFD